MPVKNNQLRVLVAESVSPKDFYNRDWEGRVVEEVVRLLAGYVHYRIVITRKYLLRGIAEFYDQSCTVFHLSAHGDEDGIALTDGTDIGWTDLASLFDPGKRNKATFSLQWSLVLSSCCGGTKAVAKAFEAMAYKPAFIFGSEATDEEELLTFPSACIAWPILYSELQQKGVSKDIFQDAVKKMNLVLPHQFVYRRWDTKLGSYRRYSPSKAGAANQT